MVLVAAIALLFGSGANPTGALIAIFVVVFGFTFALLYLQRRDTDRGEARAKREALEAAEPVDDPTTADQTSLLVDLATGQVDRDAIAAASSRSFGFARNSIGSGAVMMVLIGCAVIPWQLSAGKEIWSLVTFVPAIALYAVYLAAKVIIPGGTLDQAYDDAGPTVAALGLTEAERPKVRIGRTPLGSRAFDHDLDGAIAYTGKRHGRHVSVRIEGSTVTTELSGKVTGFEVRARGERLQANPSSPEAVGAVLAPLRASSYWKGVTVRGGNHGVTVERKGNGAGAHWMRDLWLAEHLADAAKD